MRRAHTGGERRRSGHAVEVGDAGGPCPSRTVFSSAAAPLGGHEVVCRCPRGSAGDSRAPGAAAADRVWNSPPPPAAGASLLQGPLEQLGVR